MADCVTVPAVEKKLSPEGTATSILTTSPTVVNVVLEPPESVLKYKSVPLFPLNISEPPPLFIPLLTLLLSMVCVSEVYVLKVLLLVLPLNTGLKLTL